MNMNGIKNQSPKKGAKIFHPRLKLAETPGNPSPPKSEAYVMLFRGIVENTQSQLGVSSIKPSCNHRTVSPENGQFRTYRKLECHNNKELLFHCSNDHAVLTNVTRGYSTVKRSMGHTQKFTTSPSNLYLLTFVMHGKIVFAKCRPASRRRRKLNKWKCNGSNNRN